LDVVVHSEVAHCHSFEFGFPGVKQPTDVLSMDAAVYKTKRGRVCAGNTLVSFVSMRQMVASRVFVLSSLLTRCIAQWVMRRRCKATTPCAVSKGYEHNR
jgi:hypothetical protein